MEMAEKCPTSDFQPWLTLSRFFGLFQPQLVQAAESRNSKNNLSALGAHHVATWSASAILSLIFQLCLYVANAYLAAHFIAILVSKLGY